MDINQKIIVEVSARHCHLAKEDLEKLFGAGHELEKLKQLYEPLEFACKETVDIQFGSKKIEKVRVVGPLREQTQVEISLTDAIGSGIMPAVKLSGDLHGSSKAILQGPVGQVELSEGLIVAQRHLHCSTDEAKELNLETGDIVSVKIESERPVIFGKVIVRVKDGYKLSLHLDTDEGNAAGINKAGEGFLILDK